MVRDRADADDDGRFLLCFEIYNQTRTPRVVGQLEMVMPVPFIG